MTDDPESTRAPLHLAYRVSGLARPVDPAYPTNKALLVLVPLVFMGAAAWTYMGGASLADAGAAGLEAGLMSFLVWALTREMSPDDNPAAFVAVALSLLVWPRVGEQSLLLLGGVLVAVRLVNRSTGKAAEMADSLLAALLFAALAWFSSWTLGLVGALALALDGLLPAPAAQAHRKHHLGLALVPAGAALAVLLMGTDAPALPAHLPVFATIAGLCLLAVLATAAPSSVGDVDGEPLSHTRVRLGLGVGLLAAVALSFDSGFRLQSAASLWACVLAVPLGLPIARWRRRRAAQSGE